LARKAEGAWAIMSRVPKSAGRCERTDLRALCPGPISVAGRTPREVGRQDLSAILAKRAIETASRGLDDQRSTAIASVCSATSVSRKKLFARSRRRQSPDHHRPAGGPRNMAYEENRLHSARRRDSQGLDVERRQRSERKCAGPVWRCDLLAVSRGFSWCWRIADPARWAVRTPSGSPSPNEKCRWRSGYRRRRAGFRARRIQRQVYLFRFRERSVWKRLAWTSPRFDPISFRPYSLDLSRWRRFFLAATAFLMRAQGSYFHLGRARPTDLQKVLNSASGRRQQLGQ